MATKKKSPIKKPAHAAKPAPAKKPLKAPAKPTPTKATAAAAAPAPAPAAKKGDTATPVAVKAGSIKPTKRGRRTLIHQDEARRYDNSLLEAAA